MTMISARVDQRILQKADRFFTGTTQGRIIELLQNARRAGATYVEITNAERIDVKGKPTTAIVSVRDNGSGIEDFAQLLNLGGSGWSEGTELSEDPAGIGFFSLAPATVTVESRGRKITIDKGGWQGIPIDIEDGDVTEGTLVAFRGEPWTYETLFPYARFTGMTVAVDGRLIQPEPYLGKGGHVVHVPELGVKLRIDRVGGEYSYRQHTTVEADDIGPDAVKIVRREYIAGHTGGREPSAVLNFHGQTLMLSPEVDGRLPDTEQFFVRVDLTGEPTPLRLMLPARTQMVNNEAYATLIDRIELECYRYLRGKPHRLQYKNWVRATELGIELPEPEPQFTYGVWSGGEGMDIPEIPEDRELPFDQCCVMPPADDEEIPEDSDLYEDAENAGSETVHLFALLADVKGFCPVKIRYGYADYSWAKALPRVTTLKVTPGKELAREFVASEQIVGVDSLRVAIGLSDGRQFEADVPVAARSVGNDMTSNADNYVTLAAKDLPTDIFWDMAGGFCDDSDTYSTQQDEVEKSLMRLFRRMRGPYEAARVDLLEHVAEFQRQCAETLAAEKKIDYHAALAELSPWDRIEIRNDPNTETPVIEVTYQNGQTRTFKPA